MTLSELTAAQLEVQDAAVAFVRARQRCAKLRVSRPHGRDVTEARRLRDLAADRLVAAVEELDS